MPLGYHRQNERHQRPNPNINFIKPLPGPDESTAHDFLSRIAAISTTITRTHHIGVNSLEEFPPNREFWGRNFNNGECIQLVLKSPKTGRWLPLRFVQMVFMHELAHVHQMNHGREFWKLRNIYSEELKTLWGKGFLGEGLWGRGRSLYDGQISDHGGLPTEEQDAVAATCGGTFRGVRGGRKRKQKLSHKEQKERRIKKKFGVAGQALGDDDATRVALEKGKKAKGKPRVAGSNRGRELRAAAALARFDTAKAEPTAKLEDEEGSETESDYGSDFDEAALGEQAKGADGQTLLDSHGFRLVKVCEGEDDAGDGDAKREMEELSNMGQGSVNTSEKFVGAEAPITLDEADVDTASEAEHDTFKLDTTDKKNEPEDPDTHASDGHIECRFCTLHNPPSAVTCDACSFVLRPDPSRFDGPWECTMKYCRFSGHRNPAGTVVCSNCDVGRDGADGSRWNTMSEEEKELPTM